MFAMYLLRLDHFSKDTGSFLRRCISDDSIRDLMDHDTFVIAAVVE